MDERVMEEIRDLQQRVMKTVEDDKIKRILMQALVREARNDLLKGRETRALALVLNVLDMILTGGERNE